MQNFFEVKRGLSSWLFTMDHKRIGILYLFSILTFLALGFILGLLIRVELMFVGDTFLTPGLYNTVFTFHGVIMIFLFVIPGLGAVFGNFALPMQIGAEDVAFPRLNLLSFWLFITGAVVAVIALFSGGKFGLDTGWTFYVPYAMNTEANVSLAVFGAFMIGFSSILTGLNFVTTVHRLRMKGMTWDKVPLFTWAIYAAGWIQIMVTPVVGITLVLVILERVLHIGVFDPIRGGDPTLYQHLFWIYSHPAVYIMILPSMGAISEIVPVFSRKHIFGYSVIVGSGLFIAIVGSFVWVHHMYTAGISDMSVFIFSLLTFVVGVPSAVKVFNWIGTMYKGSIVLRTPMYYALAYIFLFTIGGLMGLVNASAGGDIHVQDTHFVVSHFHFMMLGGVGFGFFAALHYWFPKMFGRMYNEKIANGALFTLFIGFLLHYIPMAITGFYGQPRRYYDYLQKYEFGNMIAGVGGILLVVGLLLVYYNILVAIKNGQKAEDNPWGAITLDWQNPSPPPLENWVTPPTVTHGPYEFDKAGGQ